MIAITVIVSGVQARAWSRILVHGAAAMAAVVGFLFAISPVLFTNVSVVVSCFAPRQRYPSGGRRPRWFGNLYFYATGFATSADIILLVCFALGVLWSVRLRLVQTIPLWLGVFVWVILSRLPIHWERWGLPMYLTPLLVAPIGAYYSFRYILDKGAARWLRWGAVGLGAVVALNLVAGSVAVSATYRSRRTPDLCDRLRCARHRSHHTVFEGYSPLLPGEPQTIFGAFTVIDGRLVLSSQGQNRSGMRYVVLSSGMYAPIPSRTQVCRATEVLRHAERAVPLSRPSDPTSPGKALSWRSHIWNDLRLVAKLQRWAGGPYDQALRDPQRPKVREVTSR